ncbi:unnamed protein product [Didymodactylos carnosus]|uniref:Uncharacterized protein n=1 Tax=Didymodactylos carnosus TaxID=1234261 RepID=A0A814LVG9_9BILA|nr:unnamed protein product [Didymodactylos carnosus]CAF1070863.1 unnamed protein product [Didymodactylos carnosus]CAF3667513.1 unnamed protein product [Didymodactylos carnosus]CAF3838074.1 unnamed protein product [Didymodactylos carnosus]
MDTKFFRQVPYRFIAQDRADACKIDKLTNLFPEMKSTIELELFKINNLSHTLERLSRVYSISTALDIRDDTLHVFVGPYHIRLGPALFAAFHFKQVSQTLMQTASKKKEITTNSTTLIGGSVHTQRRQREAAIRRFRRAVRKIGLVKQVLDLLQTASVLTPVNQYALHSRGIYELVLRRQSVLTDGSFELFEQMKNYQASNEGSPFLSSNFVKITSLLNLLGSSTTQQQPEEGTGNSISTKANETILPVMEKDLSKNQKFNPNSIDSKDLVEDLSASPNNCCVNHSSVINQSLVSVPSPATPQLSTTAIIPFRRRSVSATSKTTQIILTGQNMANSTDNAYSDTLSSTGFTDNTKTILPITEYTSILEQPPEEHSSSILDDEESLINSISHILTNHLMLKNNYDTTNDSSITDSGISLNTNSGRELKNNYDFDRLIQRIKMNVGQKLFENDNEQQLKPTNDTLTSSSIPVIIDHTREKSNRRQQLLGLHVVSCDETRSDDYYNITDHTTDQNNKTTNTNKEKSSKKHHNWASKSHSFDMTNSSKLF